MILINGVYLDKWNNWFSYKKVRGLLGLTWRESVNDDRLLIELQDLV